MGFTADVAFITADQFHAITQERLISGRDEGESTLANALEQATNYVIKKVRARGVPPDKVANVADFQHIAAYWAARRILEGMPGDTADVAQKILTYTERLEEEWRDVVIDIENAGRVQTQSRRGRPRVINFDQEPVFGPSSPRVGPVNTNPVYETRKFSPPG